VAEKRTDCHGGMLNASHARKMADSKGFKDYEQVGLLVLYHEGRLNKQA
jgi:hypothetical protein